MKRLAALAALAGATGVTQIARAQVMALQGVPGGRILDFDVRWAPLGPIGGMDPVFRSRHRGGRRCAR